MSDHLAAVLAGIDRREALARSAAEDWWDPARAASGACVDDGDRHIAANGPAHVLAVLAAAREELADAASQREQHVEDPDKGGDCVTCFNYVWPCPDARQAARTLARLARLYGYDTPCDST